MKPRAPQLIGSIPGTNLRGVLAWQMSALPGLPLVSDGELDRPNWVATFVTALRDHPDLEVKAEGQYSGYSDILVHRVKKGRRLTSDSMTLEYPARTGEVLAEVDAVADELGLAAAPDLLVGIADPRNLALFSLGPSGLLFHTRPFRELVATEVATVHAQGGDRAVVQLEAAFQLVATVKAGPLRGPVARWLARDMVRVVRGSPARTRFGVHLCLGDLNHHSMVRLATLEPVVALANAIVSAWPADRRLEYIHAPLAAAGEPVPVAKEYYQPLGRLRLPADVRFVAGLVEENQDVTEQRQALHFVERELGPVDVAATCGLGRRTPQAAQRWAQQARQLLAEPPTPAAEATPEPQENVQ